MIFEIECTHCNARYRVKSLTRHLRCSTEGCVYRSGRAKGRQRSLTYACIDPEEKKTWFGLCSDARLRIPVAYQAPRCLRRDRDVCTLKHGHKSPCRPAKKR